MDTPDRTPRSTDRTRKVPRLTSEIFVIPFEEGKYIVYAPLRRAALVGSAAVVRLLAALAAGETGAAAGADENLIDILRRMEVLDSPAEIEPIRSFEGPPRPTSVTLLLTTACNLRCDYCYALTGEVPARRMTLETAQRGIDFVLGNAIRRGERGFEVSYHGGGEPTLNWRTLTGSWEYARARAAESDLEVRGALATNGMLTDESIDWIVAHLDGVSVSCDGSPAAHDRHRRTPAGTGSSERIWHTLRRFDDAGFRYGIRLTVTADQVAELPDSIDYVCENFRAQALQVEPVYLLGRWHEGDSAETEAFVVAYREAARRAEAGGRGISFSAARLDTITNHFCGASQDNFCLSTDGNVTACYEVFHEGHPFSKFFFYGRPGAGGYEFDEAVLAKLRAQAVERRPFCASCFARWHCAGDCYHKILARGGPGESVGAGRCLITRELIKDQILARIESSGGLFWHEPPCPRNGEGKRCE